MIDTAMRQPATQSQSAPASASAPVMAGPRFPVWLIAALLALVTLAAKSVLEWKMRRVSAELAGEADPEA